MPGHDDLPPVELLATRAQLIERLERAHLERTQMSGTIGDLRRQAADADDTIAQLREYVETSSDDGVLTRHNVLQILDGHEGTRHVAFVCACGDRWPDPGMGRGHTARKCESVEGAGMFDPDAIEGPDGPRCGHCRQPVAGPAVRDETGRLFWHADLDHCRAAALSPPA